MGAFVEKLCVHCGLVRFGPLANNYGDPYDGSVPYVIEDRYAVLKGFSDRGICASEYRAIIHAINDAEGKLVAYDRLTSHPYRMAQIELKGPLFMTKHTIPHTSEALSPVDHMIAIGKAGENIKAGHSTLLDHSGLNVSEQDLGDGTVLYSGPAWSARVKHK